VASVPSNSKRLTGRADEVSTESWELHFRVRQILGGAGWCTMVSTRSMAERERTVRQSVSIPAGIAKRIRTLAKTRKTSASRVLIVT
jgi:hypothetical protein